MSIVNQLKFIRRVILRNDVFKIAWIFYSILLLIFISANIIEHFFYLPANSKSFILVLFVKIVVTLILAVLVTIVLALNDVLPRYKLNRLADKTGKLLFSDPYQIHKALKIEKGLDTSSDPTSDRSFLDQTLHKLSTLNLGVFYPEATIQRWKSITVILLMLIGILIMFGWDSAAGSIYRWSHPRQDFQISAPFTLQSLSGDIQLTGDDKAEILIQSVSVSPDSVYLRYHPVINPDMETVKIRSAAPDSTGIYLFFIDGITEDHIYQAYVPSQHFWESWEEISSPEYYIILIDRPLVEKLSFQNSKFGTLQFDQYSQHIFNLPQEVLTQLTSTTDSSANQLYSALNRALQAGYPIEYQKMIIEYFNKLIESGFLDKKISSSQVLDN